MGSVPPLPRCGQLIVPTISKTAKGGATEFIFALEGSRTGPHVVDGVGRETALLLHELFDGLAGKAMGWIEGSVTDTAACAFQTVSGQLVRRHQAALDQAVGAGAVRKD